MSGRTRGAGTPRCQRTEPAHPSGGSSEGYDVPFRQQALTLTAAGQGALVQCSQASINRWIRNGTARLAKTGNKAPTVLRGEHQFWLCVIRRIKPKSTAAEVIAFIANNSSDHAVFTPQQISKREIELGMTRKCAATTAEQEFTPQNILRAALLDDALADGDRGRESAERLPTNLDYGRESESVERQRPARRRHPAAG